ncbi:MAG: hypothetical protein AB1646_06480 [Thermodesulfobacteriota bacterium]
MSKWLSRGMVKCGGLSLIIGFLLCVQSNGVANAYFNVGRDTFTISNSPGYCFAMAAFSRWYYLLHHGEPSLRAVLDKNAQQRLARDLQQFYSKNLITIQADYCNRFHRNQGESFKHFLSGLMIGDPRIVLLMNKGKRGIVLHAVLAYEWLPEDNVVKVYDPNYINAERFIDLEQRQYRSLDVTYNEICFPEVLDDHSALVAKMEKLYDTYIAKHHLIRNSRGRRAASNGSAYR